MYEEQIKRANIIIEKRRVFRWFTEYAYVHPSCTLRPREFHYTSLINRGASAYNTWRYPLSKTTLVNKPHQLQGLATQPKSLQHSNIVTKSSNKNLKKSK